MLLRVLPKQIRKIPTIRLFSQESSKEEASKEQTEEPQDLKLKLEETEKEMTKFKELWLRAVAEQHNITKRLQTEISNEKVYAISKFAKELLDVSDNLQRALSNAPESTEDNPKAYADLVLGVNMTKDILLNTFKKFDIEEYNPMHEKFDANFHEALYTYEDTKLDSGVVGDVICTGFLIKDRVLRSSKVGVIKNKDN